MISRTDPSWLYLRWDTLREDFRVVVPAELSLFDQTKKERLQQYIMPCRTVRSFTAPLDKPPQRRPRMISLKMSHDEITSNASLADRGSHAVIPSQDATHQMAIMVGSSSVRERASIAQVPCASYSGCASLGLGERRGG